jgi:hypothetical protein
MSSIFGGSKQTSSSSNKAYDSINSSFSPLFGLAGQGADGIMKLLGGDSSGFDAYKNATGFDFAAEQGSRGITGNAAARGLLRSGSTGKALVGYGNDMQNQYAGNYMDRLLGVSGLGMDAGKLVAGAGQTSTSKSKSKPGIGGFLGQIAGGAAASDRRLKKNIFKVGELPNGLNLYQYRYINDAGPYIGVMADEVELVQPEALGPVVDGYMTVDYDKIEKE